tara:strand:- start:44 stop:424 length:381 start_codon:yes stop_codon:yes gene_type:complete
MAHFAKIDSSNVVTEVVVINNAVITNESNQEVEQLGIDFMTQLYGAGTYKQTSYNSNMRKNMAVKGGTYDAGRDAFINPKPFDSWVLDESTCKWKPPIDNPADSEANGGNVLYQWDESSTSWKTST